jgi:hypothetical protein
LLLALGETYLHMGDPARARDTFERVVSEYHDAEQARRAELYLEFIARHYGAQPAPRPAAADAPVQNG